MFIFGGWKEKFAYILIFGRMVQGQKMTNYVPTQFEGSLSKLSENYPVARVNSIPLPFSLRPVIEANAVEPIIIIIN